MKNTGDASFLRRLASLERETLMAGKSVPFRKLVSMIAHRSIRDPLQEDNLHESDFNKLVASGTSVSAMVGFFDSLLELLGRARADIWADSKTEAKAIGELRRCTHPSVKRDLQEFDTLH